MKDENKGKKYRKNMNKQIIFALIAALVFLFSFFAWKMPIYKQFSMLDLPAGTQTVYGFKAHVSDVYWYHIKAEKVIKCDLPYEQVKKYIEENNSETALNHISIDEYGGMSDISIYNSDFDDFWLGLERSEKDKYVKIGYFVKFEDIENEYLIFIAVSYILGFAAVIFGFVSIYKIVQYYIYLFRCDTEQ